MPLKQTEWTRAYNEKAYDRLAITIPKGRKADVEAHAKRYDESINGLVNMLLRNDMGLNENEWKTLVGTIRSTDDDVFLLKMRKSGRSYEALKEAAKADKCSVGAYIQRAINKVLTNEGYLNDGEVNG